MGNRDTGADEADPGTGESRGRYREVWKGTRVHPVLPGDDLTVVERGRTALLSDPDNTRAWIHGETIEVGLGRVDADSSQPRRSER